MEWFGSSAVSFVRMGDIQTELVGDESMREGNKDDVLLTESHPKVIMKRIYSDNLRAVPLCRGMEFYRGQTLDPSSSTSACPTITSKSVRTVSFLSVFLSSFLSSQHERTFSDLPLYITFISNKTQPICLPAKMFSRARPVSSPAMMSSSSSTTLRSTPLLFPPL